jgi:hypothetical protein
MIECFVHHLLATTNTTSNLSNLLATRHALQLLRTSSRLKPARALRSIQLDIRLSIIEIAQIVQNTHLHHPVFAKSRSLAPQVGAALSTERSGDFGTRVGFLRPCLGRAGCDLEACVGDDDIGAVGGSAHLLAVGAVAECLDDGFVSTGYATEGALASSSTYLC